MSILLIHSIFILRNIMGNNVDNGIASCDKIIHYSQKEKTQIDEITAKNNLHGVRSTNFYPKAIHIFSTIRSQQIQVINRLMHIVHR